MKTCCINYTVLHTLWFFKKSWVADRRTAVSMPSCYDNWERAHRSHIYRHVHIVYYTMYMFFFFSRFIPPPPTPLISTCLMPALWVWACPTGPVPYNTACSGCECEPVSARSRDHSMMRRHAPKLCVWVCGPARRGNGIIVSHSALCPLIQLNKS